MPRSSSNQLAIDARHLQTGIGAYTRNLVQNLHALHFAPLHLITRSQYAEELRPLCERLSIVNAPIYSLKEQIEIPWSTRHQALLHVPHYNVPLLYRGTLLVTIHDITHILNDAYRKSWKARFYGAPMLHGAVRRASHIFTVSEYSKRQIVEHLRAAPEKITVVYNGVGSRFARGNVQEARNEVAWRFDITLPYVLYVGSLKPHKNIGTLLDGYARLWPGKTPDAELVIVGSGSPGDLSLRQKAAQLGVNAVFISDANDSELVQLYRAAEVLVLPSFEEGFGLPIVEAMACGTPVICSNTGAMPEVAGDAALYFDPHDAGELASVLKDLLSSADLRKSLCERGLSRATRFTWRETARRHLPVYERYLG